MARFILHAFPLLVLLLALFGFAVELLDVEPRSGSVIRLALFEQPRVPAAVVFGTWLMEAAGLLALYLLARGRCGTWWLDGLVAGWTAWIFRGPLLVITIVVAARQPREPWWTLAFGWWVLYSVCGLSLAILARRQESQAETPAEFPATIEAPGEDETLAIEAPQPAVESESLAEPEDAAEPEAATAPPDEMTEETEEIEAPDAGQLDTDETDPPPSDDSDDDVYRRAAEER